MMKNFLFKYPIVAKVLLAWLCLFGLAHAADDNPWMDDAVNDRNLPDLPRMGDEFFDRWKQPYLINYFKIADRSERRYDPTLSQHLIPMTVVQRNFLGAPATGAYEFVDYDRIIFRRHESTSTTLRAPSYGPGATAWGSPSANMTQGPYTLFLADSLIWNVPNRQQAVIGVEAIGRNGGPYAPPDIPALQAHFHMPGQDYTGIVHAQRFPEQHHTLICDGTEQVINVRSHGIMDTNSLAGYGIRIRYMCRRLSRAELNDFFRGGLENTVITAYNTPLSAIQQRIRTIRHESPPIVSAASRPPQPHVGEDQTTYSVNSRHRPPSRCYGSPYPPRSTDIGVPVAGTPALNTTGNQNEQTVYGPGGTCNLKNDTNRKLLAKACDEGSEGVTSLCLDILFPACQLQKVPTTDSRFRPCGKP